jgi:uncharacterized repeat protein (TIGR01451 family)
MRTKWQLGLSIVLFSAILVLVALFSYAWIIATFKSDPIIVETGTLDLDYTLSIANDTNHDGILDGGYVEITAGGLTFNEVTPGMVYTYRLELTNLGSINGHLDISIQDILPSSVGMNQALIIKYINPVTSLPVETLLDSSTETLFQNYVLISTGSLIFDFTITINPELGNINQSESILISYFELRLDQII